MAECEPPGVRAWRPAVAGVAEVFHARFTQHAYPLHTHDTWTLLIVDDGAVRYDLGRREHGALRSEVTLLPPHVPHNGRAVTTDGFRKRVLYLDDPFAGALVTGRAVDRPAIVDRLLRRRVHELHAVLAVPGEEAEATARLALVAERLGAHLSRSDPTPSPVHDRRLAHRLRELIDAHAPADLGLHAASARLHAHPTHLVRVFTREFGLPPHRYLIGRRVDLARRVLLDGAAPADAAIRAGFHDQPHLTRHFRRVVGTTPARFARG